MELEEFVKKHKQEIIDKFIKPYVKPNMPKFIVRDYLDDYWYEVHKLYIKDNEIYATELWLDDEIHEVKLITASYDELLFMANKLRMQERLNSFVPSYLS